MRHRDLLGGPSSVGYLRTRARQAQPWKRNNHCRRGIAPVPLLPAARLQRRQPWHEVREARRERRSGQGCTSRWRRWHCRTDASYPESSLSSLRCWRRCRPAGHGRWGTDPGLDRTRHCSRESPRTRIRGSFSTTTRKARSRSTGRSPKSGSSTPTRGFSRLPRRPRATSSTAQAVPGVHRSNAAGTLDGYTVRVATPDEMASVRRAQALLEAALGRDLDDDDWVN